MSINPQPASGVQELVTAGRSTASDAAFTAGIVKILENGGDFAANKASLITGLEEAAGKKQIGNDTAQIYLKALREANDANEAAEKMRQQRDALAASMQNDKSNGLGDLAKDNPLVAVLLTFMAKFLGMDLKDFGLSNTFTGAAQNGPQRQPAPSAFVGPPAPDAAQPAPPAAASAPATGVGAFDTPDSILAAANPQPVHVPPTITAQPADISGADELAVHAGEEALNAQLAETASRNRRDALGLSQMSMEEFAQLEQRQREWEKARENGEPVTRQSPIMMAQMAATPPSLAFNTTGLMGAFTANVPPTGALQFDFQPNTLSGAGIFGAAANPPRFELTNPFLDATPKKIQPATVANDQTFVLSA